MTHQLLLPATEPLPETALDATRIDASILSGEVSTDDIEQLDRFLAQLAPPPTHIVGSTATPTLYWLLALRAFPQAQVRCSLGNGPEKRWLDLKHSDAGDTPAQILPHETGHLAPPSAPLAPPSAQAPAPAQEVQAPVQSATTSATSGQPATDPAAASVPETAPEAAPQTPPSPATEPPKTAPEPKARPAASPSSNIRELPDRTLIFETYKYAAWGADEPEHARALDRLQEEALRRAEQNPTDNAHLPAALQKARRSGEHACLLGQQLLGKLDKTGPSAEISAWIEKVSANAHPSVRRHLDITLTKWQDRQKKLRQRANERKQTQQQARLHGKPLRHSKLETTQLINGHHPNSLRHQQPATQWDILIDETGSVFDDAADTLNPTDHTLGRVVALAVPQRAKLPELPTGFHAADATDAQVDQALQAVLNAPVGIFGFSVRDTLATSTQWIGHIHQLVRWVLLQLPLRTDQPCRVRVLIEERSGWTQHESLRALSSILEDELRELHPERYRQLTLSLDFIAKTDHNINGYVDTIAYTWGSPGKASKERLKRSRLLGHCLLRPTDDALAERLYLALDRRRTLPTADWYALCAAIPDEPEGGLLHGFADQLGEQARDNPAFWHACLDEVRQRLRLKQFRLNELAAALGWLERWCPQGTHLPATQQLRLETARLATENHRGEINPQRFERCLQLSGQLIDEAPDEACEAVLRLAVTTANNFQFDILQDTVRDWLARPVAVPGLLNHAKLHSTLGQLLAFTAQPAAAVASFDAALAAFGRLSDPAQVRRESAQTGIYRVIAQLDDATLDPDERIAGVVDHLRVSTGKPNPQAISRALACSGQQARFDHHLWLRTLVAHPQQMAAARSAYLDARAQWQAGEDHPWPLIDAYRAWLLHDAGQDEEAATYFGNAIAGCEASSHGPTLQWMAEVLRVLAQALGLPVDDAAPEPRLAELQPRLPYAPFAALAAFREQAATAPSPEAIVAGLNACLPFNFH